MEEKNSVSWIQDSEMCTMAKIIPIRPPVEENTSDKVETLRVKVLTFSSIIKADEKSG